MKKKKKNKKKNKKKKKKENKKEVNNNKDNLVNNVDNNNNNNANSQQAKINNNINIENKNGENNDKKNEIINKKEEEKNNKVDNKTKETQKNDNKEKRVSLKVQNLKPKIKPKNTSDAALNKSLNSSPKNSRQAQSKFNFQNKKENNEQQKYKSTKKNGSNKNTNQTNDNNNNKEESPKDKGINDQIVEKKETDEFDIKNIISEYRLNRLKDDEIIYSGTLDKILKIPEKNTITYSQRFCIFTKNYFAYYKSKESYISLNKPMLVINNNLIIRIENTTLDGDNYYFGIICVVNDETKDIINKVNSFVTKEGNTCELLLGFRTKQYENMMKWVIILKYFISNKNGE